MFTLLSLGTFTAGVHVLSWQICLLGLIMALGIPAIAWIENSALLVVLVVGAVVGIVAVFWWRIDESRTRQPASLRRVGLPRMLACPLRQDENTSDNEYADDRGSDRPAQCHAAVAWRLVEKIADGGAERPRQNERRPEQEDARHVGPEIKRGQARPVRRRR